MPTTEEILKGMLTENTGRALLDSGDYYGRNYQRNQGVDLDKRQPCTLEVRVYRPSGKEPEPEFLITHDVYHWLKERVDYDAELDTLFGEFAEREENKDEPWLQLAETFVEKFLPEHLGKEVSGIYHDGPPQVVNTYNGEDLLSQTLQYVYFTIEDDDEEHVLLQIHGGCDVRGGYTRPRAFTLSQELGIFDNARASIACEGYHRWDTDDGYSFHDESYPTKARYELRKCNVVALDEGETVGDKFKPGTVVVNDETHEGYCPHCAAKLSAWFY